MRTFVSALALAATLATAAAATPVAAQEVRPGQRVRLVLARQAAREARQPDLRGALVAADADSLTVQSTGLTVRVARGSVRQMYLSRGMISRLGSGAWRGLQGAALGALIPAQWDDADGGKHLDGGEMLAGAGVGAGVGMIIGAVFPSERWERIRTLRGVTVVPAVSSNAQGLAVRIRL